MHKVWMTIQHEVKLSSIRILTNFNFRKFTNIHEIENVRELKKSNYVIRSVANCSNTHK